MALRSTDRRVRCCGARREGVDSYASAGQAAGFIVWVEKRTVLTGSVMISAVIEHMYWSGTATSLTTDGRAVTLLPPSPPSTPCNASAFAIAKVAAAIAATASSRALEAAAARATSRASASRTRFAAASLAASAAASAVASHSASCCASSSLLRRARASAPPTPLAGTLGGAASSADSPPPAMAARSAASARSASDLTGFGAAAGGGTGAAAGGASLGSSPAAAARPVFLFFFLNCLGWACSLACSRASSAGRASQSIGSPIIMMNPIIQPSAITLPPSSSTAHEAAPRPSERHSCGRSRIAMAVWPLATAHCSAVRPLLSSSSVLASARSRACTHASYPSPAAIIRAVWPWRFCRSGLAECCRSRSRVERWPLAAAPMSAV
eukprot:scaffold43183_cov59-Phaeocystis_antarctica.AAC.4